MIAWSSLGDLAPVRYNDFSKLMNAYDMKIMLAIKANNDYKEIL